MYNIYTRFAKYDMNDTPIGYHQRFECQTMTKNWAFVIVKRLTEFYGDSYDCNVIAIDNVTKKLVYFHDSSFEPKQVVEIDNSLVPF